MVRDISEVTGSMAEASNAVSSVTDSAAGAVQKLFNKVKVPAADAEHKLSAAAEAEQPTERVLIGEAGGDVAAGDDDAQKPAAKAAQYYTYTSAETSEESCDE